MLGSRVDNYRYDVMIAGGGPAGLALAIELGEMGLKVLTADAADYPSGKPCGGYLSPHALSHLERLGCAAAIEALGSKPITASKLYLNHQLLVSGTIPTRETGEQQYGLTIPRDKLLKVLIERLRQTGGTIRQHCKIVDFETNHGQVCVSVDNAGRPSSILAKLIIGADGANSSIAKKIGNDIIDARYRQSTISSQVHGLTLAHKLMFYDERFYPGYGWILPVRDGICHFGVAVNDEAARRNEIKLEVFYEQFQILIRRLANAQAQEIRFNSPDKNTIRSYGAREPLYFDGGLLIGEAAGLVNPVDGEGIAQAFESAAIAAKTIGEVFASEDFSLDNLSSYQSRCNQYFDNELAASDLLVSLSRNSALRPVCLGLLKTISKATKFDKSIEQMATGILGGAMSIGQTLIPETLLRAVACSPAIWRDQADSQVSIEGNELISRAMKLIVWQTDFAKQFLGADSWGREWASEIARKQTNLINLQTSGRWHERP